MLTLEFMGVMSLQLSDSVPEAAVQHSKESVLREQDTGSLTYQEIKARLADLSTKTSRQQWKCNQFQMVSSGAYCSKCIHFRTSEMCLMFVYRRLDKMYTCIYTVNSPVQNESDTWFLTALRCQNRGINRSTTELISWKFCITVKYFVN